ncbi:hypothetical protein L4D77_18355 [Photobacterium frigidiphilum]|uniref:major capsid protein n=1 Tax=Photobacterium frigidiphilum TaxID=264736 RepID=UPI003D1185FC
MGIKGNGLPTIVDVMNRTDESGAMAMVADLLSETNEILEDIPVFEANQATSHKEVVVTKLPNSELRRFNRGTKSDNGETAQVEDGIAMYEQRSTVDVEIAKLNGNSAKWRASEDSMHLESMSQQICNNLFYGNENDDPDSMSGFMTRYGTKAGNIGKQFVDAGGTTGKLTSIVVVVWDQNTVNGRYPKGQEKELLDMVDSGKVRVTQADGRVLDCMETVYKSKLGLSIKDYRYAVRIGNIPVASLDKEGSTVDLWDLINTATWKIPNLRKGKVFIYANRTVRMYLDKQSVNKSGVRLQQTEVDGKLLDNYRGIFFRTCDAISENEEKVA